MCGIVGFAGRMEGLDFECLERMNDAIRHRGPDDRGTYFQPGIGLAMRRLSILDLENSGQPISNEDGTVWTVFNGEIYNYKALRSQLTQAGHKFRTQGDTEVLVHLYEEYGVHLVDHLRGMFAFAIWDESQRKLILARDRFGIKPMFYALDDDSLIFASEMKSLLRVGSLDRAINHQAIDTFLTFGYIPAPLTIYTGICKLLPGHLMVFQDGRASSQEYWDISTRWMPENRSTDEWEGLVLEQLKDAVESHLVSDVPLGAFLSGGVDSSLVVGLMSDSIQDPLTTFTMSFPQSGEGIIDERPFARDVAKQYGTDYNEFVVEPDAAGIVDGILGSFDEPFADDSVFPTYWISKLTGDRVKVALSGLGGDELFGGYHRYRGLLMSQYYDRVPGILRNSLLRPLAELIPEPSTGGDRVDHVKRFARASGFAPDLRYLDYVSAISIDERTRLYGPTLRKSVDFDATSEVITRPFNRCPSDDLVDRAMYTDLKTYLPDDILALSDRLSMAHSLEVRVPLIDHKLAEFAVTMPREYKVRLTATKWMLKRAARGVVPDSVIDHRKQGFESPMARWLRTSLKGPVQAALTDPEVLSLGLFEPTEIQRLMDDHMTRRRKNNKILFHLFILFRWLRNTQT